MTDSFYFDNTDGVVTLRCRALDRAGFKKHCFTTRKGGVSLGFLAQTNLSFSREDSKNVFENYRRIFNAVGFSSVAVLSNQQHTDKILTVDDGLSGSELFSVRREADSSFAGGVFYTAKNAADGFVTDQKDICLVTFVADCVPVIIADPVKKAAACVHSGWRGTAKGISGAAVGKMSENYGCDPADLIAAIGPCIGACCYEVGRDVYDEFTSENTDFSRFFTPINDEKYMLDMNGANRFVLERVGLKPENIHISYECTCHNSLLYYSHRATKGKRGNMSAMIEI